jgi:SAM-dependent methyltransferase
VTARERWLAATWPFVAANLPPPPARVVEIGCGSHGGFVPTLHSSGYDAVGIDPHAPDEPGYLQLEFEHAVLPGPMDAVVACTSLHHVTDPEAVAERIAGRLARDGMVIVVEWAWEDFDEPTARWCFERLGQDEASGWLRRRRDAWVASGGTWEASVCDWAQAERLHPGKRLLRTLDEAFDRHSLARGPYFFADLAGTSEADERAAIDAGRIRATRIDYAGQR